MKPKNIYLLLSILIATVSSQSCHWACSTCLQQHYTNCYNCLDMTAIKQIRSVSGVSVGTCSSPAYSSINGFGILILLICIGIGLFLRSQHIFYFILSLQTLGLLSLIEVAYPQSLTTLLDGFQYLMVFSKMQQGSKTSDGVLISRNMYRLEAFLTSVNLKDNITPSFILVFLTTVLLGVLLVFRKFRDGGDSCLSDKTLDTILTALRTIILMTMQEMLLLCYVGIRFGSVGGSEAVIILFYSVCLVFLLVDLNYHRVPYFRSKKLLNLVLAQRLILPVFVVLPFYDTPHLAIFITVFGVIQLIFIVKSAGKTKHYVYSGLKLACYAFIGVFIAVQLGTNKQNSSNIASVFATISLAIFLVAFVVEIILSLKQRCFGGSQVRGSQVKNKDQGGLVRTKTNQNMAVLRQDTLGEQGIEPQIESPAIPAQSHKERLNNGESDVPNMLARGVRREKKFKTKK